MKALKTILWPLCLFLIFSCSDDDSKNTVKNDVIDYISNGTWRITYFYSSDADHSSSFIGYVFVFGPSDVVNATRPSEAQMGLWRISDGNGDSDVLEDLRLSLTFNTPPEFELLTNDDWKITDYAITKIHLTDVNAAGGNDYVTLERN